MTNLLPPADSVPQIVRFLDNAEASIETALRDDRSVEDRRYDFEDLCSIRDTAFHWAIADNPACRRLHRDLSEIHRKATEALVANVKR